MFTILYFNFTFRDCRTKIALECINNNKNFAGIVLAARYVLCLLSRAQESFAKSYSHIFFCIFYSNMVYLQGCY